MMITTSEKMIALIFTGFIGVMTGAGMMYLSMVNSLKPIENVHCKDNRVILQYEVKNKTFNYETVLPCEMEK